MLPENYFRFQPQSESGEWRLVRSLSVLGEYESTPKTPWATLITPQNTTSSSRLPSVKNSSRRRIRTWWSHEIWNRWKFMSIADASMWHHYCWHNRNAKYSQCRIPNISVFPHSESDVPMVKSSDFSVVLALACTFSKKKGPEKKFGGAHTVIHENVSFNYPLPVMQSPSAASALHLANCTVGGPNMRLLRCTVARL